MKLIDLLNKIANGEELPKRISFFGDAYELFETLQFGEIYTDYVCIMEDTMLFKDEILKITMCLNDKVEVLEGE